MNKKEKKIEEIFISYIDMPKKTKKIFQDHFDFCGKNITLQQARLLQLIVMNENMTHTDISREMHIKNSTVSGIVDSLARKGLVKRKRSDVDRRKIYLIVSEDLKKQFEYFGDKAREKFSSVLKRASDEELDIILAGFRTLSKIMNSDAEEKKDDNS